MARQVTASIYCADTLLAPAQDIHYVTLNQPLFGHHSFEVVVPFDNVEGPGGSFFSQAPKRLLGQPLTIELVADSFHFNQGQRLRFKGLVTSIATSQDTDYVSSILVRGFSPDYLLTDGMKRRTFVKATLRDIFSTILSAYPANVLSYALNPRHQAPLPFVAQYNESNFDFLSRLATEYGEWFYYDGETLQLGAPAASAEQEFVADGAYNTFSFGLDVRPARVKMYEYNYERHQQFTSSTTSQQVAGIASHPFGSFALEQSEKLFPEEMHLSAEMLIAGLSELNEEAQLLKSTIAAELVHLAGRSDNPTLRVGNVIRLSGEGLGSRSLTEESFGTYRLTRVEHHLDAAGNYSNQFAALPHFLHVPPLLTHYSPPHAQPELADVIDERDPRQLGRLRVRYHWPVANPQQAETDWLRVMTPYSGHGKGHLMKPEVGSQVIVGYQGGLAEQPFIMGNMFHGDNPQKASYSPAQNGLKGIQTAGGNKFVMSETAGAQTILISNSHKKGTAILVSFEGDGSISIATNGPINLTSGDNISLAAKKNITLRAGEDILLAADKNILAETKDESISLRAQKELLLTAVSDDLTLEAGAKKVVTKAAGNIEISASGMTKISGSDIKWSKP